MTTVSAITVPAGWMGANGILKVRLEVSFPASTNDKYIRATFGGQEVQMTVANVNDNSQMWSKEFLIYNRNNASVQFARSPNSQAGEDDTTQAPFYGTVNTSSAQDLVVQLQTASGAETIVLEAVSVEVMYLP
jgi:hypothetical protein